MTTELGSTCTHCGYAHAKEDEFNCHKFSNSYTINKDGTLDSVLECEDCGLRVKDAC